MRNYVLERDNCFTNGECDELIKKVEDNPETLGEPGNYNYVDIFNKDFMVLEIKMKSVIEEYIKIYPEVNFTASPWTLTNLRVKHFLPGKHFSDWHSEHSFFYPNRILGIQVYLSDHNCGTKFYDGHRVLSKKGKATIFPTYFTHTHKGEICPENKDRYLLTGYYSFVSEGKK